MSPLGPYDCNEILLIVWKKSKIEDLDSIKKLAISVS